MLEGLDPFVQECAIDILAHQCAGVVVVQGRAGLTIQVQPFLTNGRIVQGIGAVDGAVLVAVTHRNRVAAGPHVTDVM